MAFSVYEVFVSLVSHVGSLFRPGSIYKRGTSVRRVTEGSHLPEKSAKGTPTELINEKIIIIRRKLFFLSYWLKAYDMNCK